ncbi:PREDICTED: eukaryotic translation initiation factor 4 gamma 3-like [Amphimedon queenslandica]|nr:PREDICTED: eukaryotic translation initiation factor 4 gamma 3-like [Amphimedon queenslandica]|eukprot:XP_011407685.1 PREDICTED: eukaryotic translation initiation factor 4 gamma 3-like [Amphimedon queenslandica]
MLKALEEAAPEEKKLKEAELKEWEDKSRKRSLGNIRFIGELFKLKMLSESIMHECIVRLLRSTSDEEALECFSRLITTTGKELDHPQAKQRMDRYFDRINEIIDKKKISSRIRFMLQDVQEMRKNDWVSRRQETLKTIDQIHQEAEMEAMQEKEMIRSLQPVSGKQYARDDKKRSKGDDYSGSRKGDKATGGRRDSTPDVSRIQALGNKREKTTPTLGPASLRPGGWKGGRSQGQTPPPPASATTDVKDKGPASKGPQRSSTSGTSKKSSTTTTAGGRGSQPQATRRSQSDEKSDTLKLVKDFLNPQPPPATQATPTHTTSKQDRLTEEVVERKTTTIIDELSENQDYKEAIECVIELESPGLMNVFVQTGINHSLEKSSTVRVSVGKLFDTLVAKDLLTTEKLTSGLQVMLECGEDLEVDIPKVWDFFAEIVAPLVSSSNLPLNNYVKLLREANIEERKLSRNVARTLKYCVDHSGSKEKVCQLWRGCGLRWTEIGVSADDVVGFLKDEGVSFLDSTPAPSAADSSGSELHSPDNPPYLNDLSLLFGSTVHTNDDILDLIEKKVSRSESKSEQFIRTLSRATVGGSTTGEGQSTIYNDDMFAKRLPLLKKWVDQEEELQVVVLDAIQLEVNRLRHPPGLLHKIFSSLYSIEVISESAFLNWRDRGKEKAGRGVALQSSKKFFNWLEHAETESDNDVGS